MPWLTLGRCHRCAVIAAFCFAVCLQGTQVLHAQSHTAASPPPQVGDTAPGFSLVDSAGQAHSLSEYLDGETIVVLEWFNPDCKFTNKHNAERFRTMSDLADRFASEGVVWLAINSSHPSFGSAADAALCEQRREEWKLGYPILLDPDGRIGRTYAAKTTPQMFVIGVDGLIAYTGAIDDEPHLVRPPARNYVEQALEDLVAGREVRQPRTRPYGCAVKYSDLAQSE